MPLGGSQPTGTWYPVDSIPSLITNYPKAYWVPRVKPDWLAVLHFNVLPQTAVSSPELQRIVEQQLEANGNAPTMWSLMTLQGQDDWREIQRVFFAPNDWRSRARERRKENVK